MSLAIEHLNQLAARQTMADAVPDGLGLWVPSEHIMVFRLELPKVSRRKLQEMLPWLLEDRLLSSPDDFEFIAGPELDGGLSLVYVVAKARLKQWLLLAESASVSPERMVPDFLALPYEEGRWTLYTDKGRLLVRSGVYEGFAADLEFGWQQLQLLLSQLEEPVRLSHLSSADSEAGTAIPDQLREQLDTETGKINWSFTELPVGLDILPSAYKPKRVNSLGLWVPAMSAAALLLLLSMTYMLVQSWVWQKDELLLQAAIAETYQTLFSTQIQDSALDLKSLGEWQLGLLEHQYLSMQSSPLAELSSLDSILSSCPDCVLMSLSQTDMGLSLRLKDSPRIRTRLDALEGWSSDWGTVDETGFNTLSVYSTTNNSSASSTGANGQ